MAHRILKLSVIPTTGHIRNENYIYEILRYADNQFIIRHSSYDDEGKRKKSKHSVPEDAVESILTKLRKIELHPYQQHHQILDGTTFELEVGDYHSKTILRWSYSPARGWKELDSIVEQIIGMAS